MIERSRLPIVTLILIVANLFASFAVAFDPDLVIDFGFNTKSPSFLTVFTSLFLHQNLLHLLGNMVFLAAVGAAVELATGSARFMIVYLVSGLVGVCTHFLLTMSQAEPSIAIGASGCVAGCAAYYSVRYTRLKVPVAPKKGVSVAMVTGVWLILQLIGAFVHIGNPTAVSFWAHIGGFVAGLLLSAIFRAPDLGQIKLGHEVLDRMNERGPAAVAIAARQHLKAHPGDIRALKDLAEAEKQLAHPIAEIEALQNLIDALPELEQGEPIRRLAELDKLAILPSMRRMLLADRLKEVERDTAILLLDSVATGPSNDPQLPEAILALASIHRESDLATSDRHVARLKEQFPLHPAADLARSRGWLK